MHDDDYIMNDSYNKMVLSDLFDDATYSEKQFLRKLSKLEMNDGEEVYANILQILTELEFEPNTAKNEWDKIITHKETMSKKLGRKIDFRVAMLDYFTHFNKQIKNPKIIEFKLFLKTTKMVLMDDLTNVYNKRYFHIMLTREYNQAKRYEREFSLLIIDIDDFKTINDNYGHPAGDGVLKELGQILLKHTRKEDTVCRIGGDEFAVIMPETTPKSVVPLSKRILKDFAAVNLNSFNPSLSGGVSSFPGDAEEIEELIHATDKLLYEAKFSGKNNIFIQGCT